jgi:hypothetical protein
MRDHTGHHRAGMHIRDSRGRRHTGFLDGPEMPVHPSKIIGIAGTVNGARRTLRNLPKISFVRCKPNGCAV